MSVISHSQVVYAKEGGINLIQINNVVQLLADSEGQCFTGYKWKSTSVEYILLASELKP